MAVNFRVNGSFSSASPRSGVLISDNMTQEGSMHSLSIDLKAATNLAALVRGLSSINTTRLVLNHGTSAIRFAAAYQLH